MASDPYLLERLRQLMEERHVTWTEKAMFGGDCFMVNDKMCFGTYQGGLMIRVDPARVEEYTRRPAIRIMIHGGRPMHGFLMVRPEGYDRDEDLAYLVDQCLAYNPMAKASKKKK